jgi:hypothetical protein
LVPFNVVWPQQAINDIYRKIKYSMNNCEIWLKFKSQHNCSQATEAAEPGATEAVPHEATQSEAVPRDVDNYEDAAFGEGSHHDDESDECSDVSEYMMHQNDHVAYQVGVGGPNGRTGSDIPCRTQ